MLTVCTDIIVTTLIAVHLIRARRTLSKLLPSSDMKLYTGVVAILIESALPLSVFGIIAGVLTQISLVRSVAASEGFAVCYHFFAGLFYWFCVGVSLYGFL
jgi:phospholipid N-methyltransferase